MCEPFIFTIQSEAVSSDVQFLVGFLGAIRGNVSQKVNLINNFFSGVFQLSVNHT